MNEYALRESVCRCGSMLHERGLATGSSGNISVRLDDGWLLTPTNASLGALDPARLSKLDWNGALLSGDAPSKEALLHHAMYQQRAGAGAIVHLHSTHAAAVSCTAWRPETGRSNSHAGHASSRTVTRQSRPGRVRQIAGTCGQCQH